MQHNLALHLRCTDAALRRLVHQAGLPRQAAAMAAAHALGLGDLGAQAVIGWSRPLLPRADPSLALPYTLHLDARGPSRHWPRALRSALDGTPLPVLVRPVSSVPMAQSRTETVNQSHNNGPGTLTAVLRADPPVFGLYALSAGHVWAGMSSTAVDDRIAIDIGGANTINGSLLEWAPRFGQSGARAAIDAAIARVMPDELESLVARRDWWPAGSASPQRDDVLRLRTRDIEIRGGLASMGDARLRTGHGVAGEYIVEDALWWQPQQRTEAGDSGAPIWNDAGELVALHAGGAVDGAGLPVAIAVPIDRVLVWARATVVARGEAMLRAPLPRKDTPSDLVFTPSSAPVPPATPDAEIDVLARTLWGEARGEGRAGMLAVAHVVFNRIAARSWWGRDVISVCKKPWQFSCWNANDPNRSGLLALTAANGLFAMATDAARTVAAAEHDGTRHDSGADPTAGATHYYAPHAVALPKWARGRVPCARIGRHLFFKGVA